MRFLRAAAVVLLFIGPASEALAQTTPSLPKGNFSAFGTFGAAGTDGLDGGHGGGFSVTFFFSRVLGVEGGFRRQSFDLTETGGNALVGGNLSANVVNVNLVARGASGKVQPYFSGGIAFFANDYSTDGPLAQQLDTFNFSTAEAVDSTVGLNIAGGVDVQASRRIGFFVEGRFTIASADTTGGLVDQVTQTSATSAGTQDLNNLAVNAGVRIFF